MAAQPPQILEPCVKCGFHFLLPSKPKGLREEFLQVVGVNFYRCHNCEVRYTRAGGRNLSARSHKDRSHILVLAAIGIGLLSCAALALYIQKLAHRWPF